MVHISWVGVAVTAVLLMVLGVDQGSALKCWTCSSQTSVNCHDHFNQTEDRLGQVKLQDCDNDRIHSSYSSYSTAVCKKQRQRVGGNGELITLRHCDWVTEHSNERRENGNCIGSSTAPTYIKVEYCETCTQDGCNGSPKDMLAPVWSTLVPIILYLGHKSSM